ncbi:MAG: neutral/alkaline non-lysosomal ceramidase N-terminal domain-containing protein [Planctomycetota bacterium]
MLQANKFILTISYFLFWVTVSFAEDFVRQIGVARIDITPDHPIRMAGYGNRLSESEGIEQRLMVKALAIGGDKAGPAVLISVDNCAIPAAVTEEVADRLKKKAGIPRERFVLCSTHTHTGPCLKGILPTMFGQPIPKDHQVKIDRYTLQLINQLEEVAMAALADQRQAQLAFIQGRVRFAANRRMMKNGKCVALGMNPIGPVDHAMPMIQVTDATGKLRAIVINYACHCTTLGGDFNRICGDWAGYAQEYVERDHPGVICLVTIGCGADADPNPRTGLQYAKQHGREIADEVNRLLKEESMPINDKLHCRFERIKLLFDSIPTHAEWQNRAGRDDAIGYHARIQLHRLERGKVLQRELLYPVQTWVFGKDCAMVFLAGEVVVDYVLQFKKEYDADRLWVTAYANDVPCYIPSRRILAEGGYEAVGAMIYYDRPTQLAREVEDRITATVLRLLPTSFHKNDGLTEGTK